MDSNIMEELSGVLEQLQALRNAAYEKYSFATEEVVSGKITDIVTIEKIMDGLCDFGDEERFLNLYRKVCKHIYFNYPEIVGEHVSLFRSLWMTNEDNLDSTSSSMTLSE